MKTKTQSFVLMEGEHSTEQWSAERLKCMGAWVHGYWSFSYCEACSISDLLHEAIQGENAKLFCSFHKPVKIPERVHYGQAGVVYSRSCYISLLNEALCNISRYALAAVL